MKNKIKQPLSMIAKIITSIVLIVIFNTGYAQTHKGGDTLSTKSGLKYIPLKRGEGNRPWPGQKVGIFYTVKFLNAKKTFDTNKGDEPFRFKLGRGEVISGLDEGIYLMHAGGKMKFIIPSKLAYGSAGLPNPEGSPRYLVPPSTDLVYEVELIDVK